MNNYFYIVRYFEEDTEKPTWTTQRGTVVGYDLSDAMKTLSNFYPNIEQSHLYCLEGSDCGCLELDILNEVNNSLPEF